MTQPADFFDVHSLLEFIDETQGFLPTEFLSKTFFPMGPMLRGKDLRIDLFKGKRRVAPYTSPRVEGTPVERRGYDSIVIEPPYLKPWMVTDAIDILLRQPGELPFSGGRTGADLAEERIGRDTEELMDMIRRAIEVMARDALVDAIITFSGEGVSSVADFSRDPSHEYALTGTDAWSDGVGSDPIFDIREWQQAIQEDSGVNPDFLILSEDVLEVFLNHPKVLEKLDNRRVEIGAVEFRERFGEMDSVNYIANIWGINIVTYNAWYETEAGVSTPFIPERTVIMAASGMKGSDNALHYGVIQDLKAGLVDIEQPMFPKIWFKDNPSAMYVMLQSSPITALKRPETTVKALVLEP